MMPRTLLAAAIAVPLAAAWALPVTAAPAAGRSDALVAATCTRIMRIDAGRPEFQGCTESLAGSLAVALHQDRAADAYRDCTERKLARGTPEFSRCVLDRENDGARGRGLRLDAAYVRPADSNPEDYYQTGFGLRHRREQYACAQVGLLPGTEAFDVCVNGLDTTLFDTTFPPG